MEKLCIVATERKAIGYVCLPYMVDVDRRPSYFLVEPASPNKFGQEHNIFDENELKIINTLSQLTDLSLCKRFAKGRTVREFYDKTKEDVFTQQVIPFVSRTIQSVLPLIVEYGIPIFHKLPGFNNLYETDIVKCHPNLSRPKCFFTIDKEGVLRYSLSITDKIGGEIIEKQLTGRKVYILSHSPAAVIIDNQLYRFDNIDAKKFEPFTQKRFIAVQPQSVEKYMQTFVRRCIMDYYVIARGFSIKKVDVPCKCILRIEQNVLGYSMNLYMEYSSQRYLYGSSIRNVDLHVENGEYVFYSGVRHTGYEQQIAEKLIDMGLDHVGDGRMIPVIEPTSCQETQSEYCIHPLIQWVSRNKHILNELGISVEIDDTNYYYKEYDLRTEHVDSGSNTDWFDINAVVVLDNYEIPFIRFKNNIIKGNREYKLPNGQIFILPEEWFSTWANIMPFASDNDGKVRIDTMHKSLLPPGILTGDNTYTDFNSFTISHTPMQGVLKAKLRPYQEEGFHWLNTLYENNKGGILADDMGLGKTIQTIALLSHIFATAPVDNNNDSTTFKSFNNTLLGPALIVMPVSLIHNWKGELNKFAPHLKVYEYGGRNRIKSNEIAKILRHYHVIITTYGLLRNDLQFLSTCHFSYLIVDESQNIKNASSLTYKAASAIDFDRCLMISGTPIENSLEDIWSQMNIANKGLLGNATFFKNYFVHPIERNNDENKKTILQKLIAPFILRRVKSSVASELPPITEQTIICEMTDDQKEIYSKEISGCRNELLHITDDIKPQETFAALKALTRLRLIANHPRLAIPEYEGRSGKTEQIIELIEGIVSENHKMLVFSSFVRDLQLISLELDKRDIKYTILTGQTHDRQSVIDVFQNEQEVKVFLISLKAGGVGLNLTEAEYVLMLNPWWNPQAEQQAIDRTHRIGQTKNVMVYRFITKDTIEEKIAVLQKKKQDLASTFITSNNQLMNLTVQEIKELIEQN
ncbi:MAG: DEAD/DEAH box helicase [Bacteroidales bacterium]|nr:DEAD/DEAH box helicase [Bacteroidales bacterium]